MTELSYAVGSDYTVGIPNPLEEKTPFEISFGLSNREDTAPEIVDETVLHFCHAMACLANGIDCREDRETRTEYERLDFNQVLISWADIPILYDLEDGAKTHIWKKALAFTEHTTASQFIEAMYNSIYQDTRLMEFGIKRSPRGSQRRSSARTNGNGKNTQTSPVTRSESGTAIYADFPGKAHCRKNHAGQVIRCNIAEIEVNMVGGKREYVISSTYQGEGISKYPMATTGDEYIKHQPTVQYLRGLDYGGHLAELTGVFYVNVKPEKEMTIDGVKKMVTPTYLNLNKIDLSDEQIKELAEGAEMNQAPPTDYEHEQNLAREQQAREEDEKPW